MADSCLLHLQAPIHCKYNNNNNNNNETIDHIISACPILAKE
jgi:hypothetical protein